MAKKKITRLVENELAPFLKAEGYVLYHLEFVKESHDWFLRVFIEKAPDGEDHQPGAVGTDDCEKVSRFLSDRLDELDPIEQNYYLEVSSPGMDRPLLKEEHFLRYIGELVDLRLYRAEDGKKDWTGRLLGFGDETVSIELENGESKYFSLKDISKASLTVVF